MFSLLLLTHGRQIAVARLETLRHREPFVRLAVLKARPPDSKRLPRGLIGEFLPLLICCSLEGWQQASTCHAQVVESGGHEHGARSGDLEAHQTLPAASPGTGGTAPARKASKFSTSTRDIQNLTLATQLFPHLPDQRKNPQHRGR